MSSLKDQLLAAGLTDKQSVRNARKKKQAKIPKKQRGGLSDSAKLAEQTRLEKAQQDKKLNRERQLESEKKAEFAQIKQLVTGSKIDRKNADIAYSFTHGKKIKKLTVSADQQKQLARGQICIVVLSNESFELVPKIVAEKIIQRDASYVIQNLDKQLDQTTTDDPYADYQIPDDLVW